MTKKARLNVYLKDEETKQRIKDAAAKSGKSMNAFCVDAVKERLARDKIEEARFETGDN